MKYLDTKTVVSTLVALAVGIGAGYLLPHAASANTTPGGFAGRSAGSFARGNQAGNGLLTGTVAKTDSGSITLDTRDGSSHVVLVTPATAYSKSVSGSLSDISVGSTVIVSGITNSDGSISAALVQVRPAETGVGSASVPQPN